MAKFNTTLYVPVQVEIDLDYCRVSRKTKEQVLQDVRRQLADGGSSFGCSDYSWKQKPCRLLDIKEA